MRISFSALMAKRGISKSLHSDEQRAFCALMIETRRKTGMTRAQLANKLRKPQSFVKVRGR